MTEDEYFDSLTPEQQRALVDEWEAEQEAEIRAEFVMSWVCGGGSSSDASFAWSQHREDYLAGRIG